VDNPSWDNGDLEVSLCAGEVLEAQQTRVFSFVLTNPSFSQESEPVSIAMSTDTTIDFGEQVMDRPGQKKEGVLGFTDPPKVVVAELTELSIEQSTALAGQPNRITVTLESSVDAAGTFELCCFVNHEAPAILALEHVGGPGCTSATFGNASNPEDPAMLGLVRLLGCALTSQV
jgi:hypothetical protein